MQNVSYSSLPHILIVDDDDRIRRLLYRFLKEHGFVLAMAEDAFDAEQMMAVAHFDCLVVDVMMPGKTGTQFVEELRQASNDIPVIMLTALGEIDDRIKGLEVGADDYLPKPFEPKELLLRLQALLKRRVIGVPKADLFVGAWQYDPDRMELVDFDRGMSEKLTVVEARLLDALLVQSDRVISREDLAMACDVDPNGRTIDVQVTRLRRKLEADPKNPRYLLTIRGQGYVLRVN